MSEIQAINIQSRDDVFKIISGDIIKHNGLSVLVKHIVCAQGGDMCIEGVAISYSSDHKYNLYYGDLVFWGPKCIARNLMDYLAGKGLGKHS